MPFQLRCKHIVLWFMTSRLMTLMVQFFFRQELLQKYRYYWRVECVSLVGVGLCIMLTNTNRPDVTFFCDIDYDVSISVSLASVSCNELL